MRGLVVIVGLQVACAGAPASLVSQERLPLLARCQALAVERDRAVDAAWAWEDQVAALAEFWRAAEAAGCVNAAPGWEI